MIRTVLVAALLLAGFACLVSPALAQKKPSGTEFKDGWNTWATSKEGDWAEYQIGETTIKRFDVKKVSGETVQVIETLTINGKKNDPKEGKVKNWWDLKLMSGSLPTQFNIVWIDSDVAVGAVTLKCNVASWLNQSLSNEVFLCKTVPCGGLVKHMMNDKATVWLRNYGDKDHKDGFLKEAADPNAGKSAALPGFYGQVGNYCVHQITSGAVTTYSRREVISFDAGTSTFTDTACDREGKVAADTKGVETKWTSENWGKLYGTPTLKAEKLKVAAGEYLCDLFETVAGKRITKEWITPEGVVAKSEIKEGDVVTTRELVFLRLE